MKNGKLEKEDIYLAYRKLKSAIYYDNSSLFLRKSISEFERDFSNNKSGEQCKDEFYKKTQKLLEALNVGNDEYINNLLNKIDSIVLPKDVKGNNSEDSTFLTNVVNADSIDISKFNIFIDAPIEIHIISVLWLMFVGSCIKPKNNRSSYAYHLSFLHENDDNRDTCKSKSIKLFDKYYIGYQNWRDNALKTAKCLLDNKQDATLVSLDIRKFYYSARVDLLTLMNKYIDESSNNYCARLTTRLNKVLHSVHQKYYQVICDNGILKIAVDINNADDNKYPLPVGLLSSGHIANLYLKEWDDKVLKVLNPDYYGRYVDDMLFVFHDLSEEDARNVIIEKFCNQIDDASILEQCKENEDEEYKLNGYDNLKIQKAKTIVAHFSHSASRAALNKFIENINNNRSEFRFLPHEDYVANDFDNASYVIQYSDSINKFRSISGFKQDKFGASIYLAQKIYLSIYASSGERKNELESANQILTFFQNITAIKFHTLWEKVVIYFAINDDIQALKQFNDQVHSAIELVTCSGANGNNDIIRKIKNDLNDYRLTAMAMGLSMNISLIEKLNLKKDGKNIYEIANDIRLANMFRHHCVGIKGINYTSIISEVTENLYSIYFSNSFKPKEIKEAKDFIYYFSPRYLNFDECCNIATYKTLTASDSNRVYENSTKILDDAFEKFWNVNYKWIYKNRCNAAKEKVKPYIYNNDVKYYVSVQDSERNYNKDKKLRVAVANMKVEMGSEKELIEGKFVITAKNRDDLFSVINEAIKNNVDILVLPELSVPYQWMDLLSYLSRRHNMCIVAGMTYFFNNSVAYNFVTTFLPVKIDNYMVSVVVPRIKNHYSPKEIINLEGYRYKTPNNIGSVQPRPYYLFHWRNYYFAVYNCFELSAIEDRSVFKSEVDFIVATEYNKDTNYFSDIVGSWSRDIHCYVIQVNTSNYGDSLIVQPTKTENKHIIRVKGGLNAIALVDDIDISKLRNFQYKNYSLQSQNENDFKMTPPMFNKNNVKKRIDNEELY